jgi:hypothetical protein
MFNGMDGDIIDAFVTIAFSMKYLFSFTRPKVLSIPILKGFSFL